MKHPDCFESGMDFLGGTEEAARAALDELKDVCACYPGDVQKLDKAKLLLRTVLAAAEAQPNLACKSVQARLAEQWGYVKAQPAQPVGEPVAWACLSPSGQVAYFDGKPMLMPGPVGNVCHTTPLYAPPPAQPAAQQTALPSTMAEQFIAVVAGIWHEHPDYSIRQTLDALNARFPAAQAQLPLTDEQARALVEGVDIAHLSARRRDAMLETVRATERAHRIGSQP